MKPGGGAITPFAFNGWAGLPLRDSDESRKDRRGGQAAYRLPVALAADTITYRYRSDTITYRYRFMTTKDLVDNSQPALTTMKIWGGPLALLATHPAAGAADRPARGAV
jgi:hypothetical protein